MSASDPLAAIAAYLKTTPVNAAVSGRVFRPKLDQDLASQMPIACVVLHRAGGYGLFGGSLQPVGDPRVDVLCYGETDLKADQVAGLVISALRALRTCTFENTRLMWARIEGGPIPLIDEKTNWPCSALSAQVAHCELRLA